MSENPIGWPTIVTAAVALYGAVLSTVNLLLSRKERRRQVKVTLDWATRLKGSGGREALIAAEAANPGSRPVTLVSFVFVWPSGWQAYLPDAPSDCSFPHELAEGKTCSVWTAARDMANILKQEGITGKVRLVAQFRDALGTAYRSEPFVVDRETLLKRAAEAEAA
jgi:hypothetical protein